MSKNWGAVTWSMWTFCFVPLYDGIFLIGRMTLEGGQK